MEQIIKELRELKEPVPKPLRLPSVKEVSGTETELRVSFHPDFVKYLLEASDVVYGTIEPATITNPESHTHLPEIAKSAWEDIGVPKDIIPICEDNSDYYCMNKNGEVLFWSHNGLTDEKWPNLAT